MSRTIVLLLAIACGLSVATVYCAQPLLDAMAAEFRIGQAAIGMVVTLTQTGYALGLVLVVPLGDLVDRRRLVVGQFAIAAAALGVVAAADRPALLFAGMIVIGLAAVSIQVLVAFAAALAPPAVRGRTVGAVTSGVVAGILLARFAAGLVADLGGWRAVYATFAGLALGMAFLLHRLLPPDAVRPRPEGYLALLRSVPALFRDTPVLRVRAFLALLIFAVFSTFWTALVLPLSALPLSLSHSRIGLFGLAGLAGALAAGGTGRLADRGFGRWATGTALVLMLLSWGFIAQLDRSIPALAVGIVLLDLAVQAVHVTSQSLILAARPAAGSRIVGGYMVFYSIGSGLGAIGSTLAYAGAGWPGVCLLGGGLSAAALVFWGWSTRLTGC